jgi:hypothetical protein
MTAYLVPTATALKSPQDWGDLGGPLPAPATRAPAAAEAVPRMKERKLKAEKQTYFSSTRKLAKHPIPISKMPGQPSGQPGTQPSPKALQTTAQEAIKWTIPLKSAPTNTR